jgi:hypothetical protein
VLFESEDNAESFGVMSRTGRVELGLIAAVTVSFFLVAGVMPERISVGNLLLKKT